MIKNFLAYCIICISSISGLQAQQVFMGRIIDLADGKSIANANISIKGEGIETHSNFVGDYFLRQNENWSDSTLSFVGNALVWAGFKQFSLELIDFSGRTILTESIASDMGFYQFNAQSVGFYLLQLDTGKEKRVFKMWSNGSYFQVADSKAPGINQKGHFTDTIVVSKKGYETRSVAISNSGIQDIYLRPTNNNKIDYLLRLQDSTDYNALASTPSRSNLGQIKAIKLVYDINKERLYYVNTEKHNLHYLFCEDVLSYGKGLYHFNQHQYKQSPLRYFLLGDLNYFESQDLYVLQFVASNAMNCAQINRYLDKIKSTSFIGEKLFFLPIIEDWKTCDIDNTIDLETLYEGQDYQGLNLTEGYGYLQKVKLEDQEETYLGRRDIVVFDGIPNDVSVVAGIITSEFQTPLSHINVLSNSRGTPNMTLRSAFTNELIDSLTGELVYLSVKADDFTLRKANLAEAEAFWKVKEPQKSIILEYSVSEKSIMSMDKLGYKDVESVGGKAAQFAEILKVNDGNKPIPTPENSFAIPFYFYNKHLESHGIDNTIANALASKRFNAKPAFRKERLQQIRDTIFKVPLDRDLINQVAKEIENFRDFESFRFRSSTNAEDLEDFSGAGLYGSFSAKKNHETKTIENALKLVWASLWNWRAFEERSYFKIDHQSCMMGVLVHRSFPSEDANGVILTTNLYNANPGIIINAQYQEHSIVYPEKGILHDQIMVYTWSINRNRKYTIEYLSKSNVEDLNGMPVLTDKEIEKLTDFAMNLKLHFFYKTRHNQTVSFDDFALDIEFKVDSELAYRKIYVKQARIYKR